MRILVIDDNEVNVGIYLKILSTLSDAECTSFTSSGDALRWCATNDPDLVLVDYLMPSPNGIEFIEMFRLLDGKRQVPIVMVTAERDRDVRHKALEAGATDFLNKPADPVEFLSRARNLLALRESQRQLADRARLLAAEVRRATAELIEREQETIHRLTRTAEFRDNETGNHIVRMGHFSALLAGALGLTVGDQELILLAAPMHDIGKVATPDHILLKPGKLTPDEWVIMRGHAIAGYEILKDSKSKLLQKAAEIAVSHHEKYDGSGYPYGLVGDAIPLSGRICAVSDVFDALTSRRPYKPVWTFADARQTIERGSGRHFDPRVIEAFSSAFDDMVRVKEKFADTVAA